MPNIGPIELIIVLVIALVILGPKRLPAAGRSLGQGLREFRDGISGRGGDAPAQIPPREDTGPEQPPAGPPRPRGLVKKRGDRVIRVEQARLTDASSRSPTNPAHPWS